MYQGPSIYINQIDLFTINVKKVIYSKLAVRSIAAFFRRRHVRQRKTSC